MLEEGTPYTPLTSECVDSHTLVFNPKSINWEDGSVDKLLGILL